MSNQSSIPVVDIQSFAMSFGSKEVVKDLSFTVSRGEVFGLLGSNGAAFSLIPNHYTQLSIP